MTEQSNSAPAWDRKPAPSRKPTWWALVFGLLGVLFFFGAMLPGLREDFAAEILRTSRESEVDRGPALFGYGAGLLLVECFILAGIAWALIYFPFVKPRAPGRGPLYFMILFAVPLVLGGLFLGAVRTRTDDTIKQDRMAVHDMAGDMKNAKSLVNGQATIDPTVRATGSAGEVERIVKTLMTRSLAEHHAYKLELDGIGFKNVLSAQRVAADPGLHRTRAILAEARAIDRKYQQRIDALITEVRAQVNADRTLSDQEKVAFLKGVDQSYAEAHDKMVRMFALDDGLIADLQTAASVLARSEGRWTVRRNTFVFINSNDRIAYVSAIAAARVKANEEQALRETNFSDLAAQGGKLEAEQP